MKYQLLMPPDGDGPTLIGEGSTPEETKRQLDIQRDFDGSVPVFEFSIAPEPDPFYEGEDIMELNDTQRWVIAKLVQVAFRAGYEHALQREDDRPPHCPGYDGDHL